MVHTAVILRCKLSANVNVETAFALQGQNTWIRWTKFSSILCQRAENSQDFLPSLFRSFRKLPRRPKKAATKAKVEKNQFFSFCRVLVEQCSILKAICLQPLIKSVHMAAFASLTKSRPDLDGLASIFGDSKGETYHLLDF